MADLLVCDKLDGGVGEDAQQRGRVPAVQAGEPVCAPDVAHRAKHAGPAARVLGKLPVARLEQDLDAVERGDQGFCLEARAPCERSRAAQRRRRVAYGASRGPPRQPAAQHVVERLLVGFCGGPVSCGRGCGGSIVGRRGLVVAFEGEGFWHSRGRVVCG